MNNEQKAHPTVEEALKISAQLIEAVQSLEDAKNSGELSEEALAEYEQIKQRIAAIEAKAKEKLKQRQINKE
jgi:uncharacterized protein YjaG (DUF416 family)